MKDKFKKVGGMLKGSGNKLKSLTDKINKGIGRYVVFVTEGGKKAKLLGVGLPLLVVTVGLGAAFRIDQKAVEVGVINEGYTSPLTEYGLGADDPRVTGSYIKPFRIDYDKVEKLNFKDARNYKREYKQMMEDIKEAYVEGEDRPYKLLHPEPDIRDAHPGVFSGNGWILNTETSQHYHDLLKELQEKQDHLVSLAEKAPGHSYVQKERNRILNKDNVKTVTENIKSSLYSRGARELAAAELIQELTVDEMVDYVIEEGSSSASTLSEFMMYQRGYKTPRPDEVRIIFRQLLGVKMDRGEL